MNECTSGFKLSLRTEGFSFKNRHRKGSWSDIIRIAIGHSSPTGRCMLVAPKILKLMLFVHYCGSTVLWKIGHGIWKTVDIENVYVSSCCFFFLSYHLMLEDLWLHFFCVFRFSLSSDWCHDVTITWPYNSCRGVTVSALASSYAHAHANSYRIFLLRSL